MRALSGYPEIDTVGIIGWTPSTRPRRSPNGNYLLGYNESTQELELVGENGNLANITKSIALFAHPVGSIYETTDVSFDPNTAWGGVWELMEDGRFLLSTSTEHAINSVGGEEETLITIQEMPNHDHLHTHQHTHTKGTLEHRIVGEIGVDDQMTHYYNGAFYTHKYLGGSPNTTSEGGDDDGFAIKFDSTANGASTWSGHVSYDDTVNSDSYVGGGQAHNNMPPYRVVRRWHRIG